MAQMAVQGIFKIITKLIKLLAIDTVHNRKSKNQNTSFILMERTFTTLGFESKGTSVYVIQITCHVVVNTNDFPSYSSLCNHYAPLDLLFSL